MQLDVLAGLQTSQILGAQLGLRSIQLAVHRHPQIAVASAYNRALQLGATRLNVHIAAGQQFPMEIQARAAAQRQRASLAQLTVGLGAGGHAALARHRGCFQPQRTARRQATFQLGCVGGGHLQRALAASLAAVLQLATAVELDVLLAEGLAFQHQVAGAGQLQIAGARRHFALLPNPHPHLGAHQADGVGVHPSQLRHVQCEGRCGAAISRQRSRLQGVRVHLIAAQHQLQLLGVKFGIHLQRTADDGEFIDIAGVQARAADADDAAVDLKAGQSPLGVELRRAGAQHRLLGVDEAATATADAPWVGYHHLRALACHFQIAVQLRGVGVGDFVEDDAGAAASQIGVTTDIAGQLGINDLRAIIEHRPLGADVELLVLVVGHASGAGRGDLHHRQSIIGLNHRRPLACHRAGIGNDVGCQRRAAQADAHPQRTQFEAEAARGDEFHPRRILATAAALALPAGGFLHRHQLAARLIEDDAIE